MSGVSTIADATGKTARPAQSLRKLKLLLFALFGLAYALFSQDSGSWNTLCRAAMTANMVQHGRIDMNGYDTFTDDKAFRDGNYYCDKAPAMSFLAAPAAFVFTQAVEISPEKTYSRTWMAFLFICAVTTSGLICAAAAVMLFGFLLTRTQSMTAALAGAVAFGLGTPVWGWATSFYSHAATAALLVMGFIAFDSALTRLKTSKSTLVPALVAGLAFGAATATEYTALIAAVIIGAGFACVSPRRRPVDVIVMFAIAAAGALAALTPVLVFHAFAFGSPFTAGYAYTVVFTAHTHGLFGIGAPNLDVVGKLLVSAERGVLWYAPIVLAMLWAAARLMRQPGLRMTAVVVVLVALWYLMMNAGFYYWEGGASTGPRYLTPALGFGALGLGLAWPAFGVWERRGALALLAVSVLINFACTAVDMTAGGLVEKILPDFLAGDLRHTLSYQLAGRPGLIHFVLPVLAGAVLSWLIWREARRLGTEMSNSRATRDDRMAHPLQNTSVREKAPEFH